MECPKDFICRRSGFENLCKVKDIGMAHLICLGAPTDRICRHTVTFDCEFLCTCPLRTYIARTLEISHPSDRDHLLTNNHN
ncbi:MAG: hypothetical protein ACYS6I_01175 [Planctomycetota bacterium]